jgi:hypothetical protein
MKKIPLKAYTVSRHNMQSYTLKRREFMYDPEPTEIKDPDPKKIITDPQH